ncbi:MAG: hypothetical protein LUI39_06250 [Lachnospiraceae bacterium]|nr:hypothetical protein [Lachnospiraceae bacterium]
MAELNLQQITERLNAEFTGAPIPIHVSVAIVQKVAMISSKKMSVGKDES